MNILLTGPNRGLGLEIAQTLLQEGHVLWGMVRSLSKELDELREVYPNTLRILNGDLDDLSSLREILQSNFIQNAVPLHGVVNNAAIAYDDLVTNLNPHALEQMFRVNVTAPMEITRVAIKNMLLHRTHGSLVHISSICSQTGYKGLAMYGATKGAIESFSRGVAREWGSRGIRSNCVLPGFMETDMAASLDVEQREKIYKRTSLRKATDARSVAETVAFLLSDASRSITGQNFIVDAGSL